jgi:hypothetical protein
MFQSNQWVHVFMICQQWAAIINSISHLFSVTNSEQCVVILRYNLDECVLLYDAYVKYGSATKKC